MWKQVMGNNKSRSRLQIKMPRMRAHNNDRKTKGIKNDSKKGREKVGRPTISG